MDWPLIVSLFCMSAFFSGSESALFSIRWWRIIFLKHNGGKPGRRLAELMEHPGSLLMTILLGNTVVNIAISSLFEHSMERYFPDNALLMSIGIVTPIVMILGEITPKTLALQKPEQIGLRVAPMIRWLTVVMRPVRWIAEKVSGSSIETLRRTAVARGSADFLSLADEGRQAGILSSSEHHILTRILEMKTIPVTDVMVPRTEMIALPDTIEFDAAVQAIRHYNFRRVPLFHESLDNIVGILYAKDLLGGWLNPVLKRSPRMLARSPVFVPSHITLKQLSLELVKRKRHLAIVLDEYGGTAGMITHDDILNTVFHLTGPGRKQDLLIRKMQGGGWRADARIGWSRICRLIGMSACESTFRTLNGFLMDHFGRIPATGETMTLDGGTDRAGGKRLWRITIEEAEPTRILTVTVTPETDAGANRARNGIDGHE